MTLCTFGGQSPLAARITSWTVE